MHLKRWITAIAAAPFVVALVYWGSPFAFAALIAAVAMAAMWEYFFIFFRGDKRRILTPIPVWGGLMGMACIAAASVSRTDILILLFFASLVGAAILSMPRFTAGEGQEILNQVAALVQSVIYIPLSLSTLILLRFEPDGVLWIFLLVFVVFLGDVGAYYVGTYFGQRKLSPAISPGKTVEGAVGGLAANLLTGIAFKALFLPESGVGLIILFSVTVGVLGQLGDLYESEMKRAAKIKDSGVILPGHGGMLDRIDALLFAAPAAYIFKIYVF